MKNTDASNLLENKNFKIKNQVSAVANSGTGSKRGVLVFKFGKDLNCDFIVILLQE